MSGLTNAIKFSIAVIRGLFKRPTILNAYGVFLLKGLLSGAITLLLVASCLSLLGTTFLSTLVQGMILGLSMLSLLFLALVLQSQVIREYSRDFPEGAALQEQPQGINRQLLHYHAAYSWLLRSHGITPRQRWKQGKHLLLPFMVLKTNRLDQALDEITRQTELDPLRFDPGQIKVHLLTWLTPSVSGLVALSFCGWILVRFNGNPTLSLTSLILTAGLCLFVFLLFFLPSLGFSVINLGCFRSDLYRYETSHEEQGEIFSYPGLLGKVLPIQGVS